jgi:hypothetical protein
MQIRTVLITADFKEKVQEHDLVDLHCKIKFNNGDILDECVKNFPYCASTKNISFDILEDEILEMVEKLNFSDEEKKILLEKSQDALERLVYKIWRTEGSI